MKNLANKNLILPLLLVILVAAALFLKYSENLRLSSTSKKVIPNYKAENVTKIEIEKNGKKTEISKKNGSFVVTTPFEVKADAESVTQLLSTFAKISEDEVASTNKDRWAVFQVDDKGTHVKLTASKNYELWIGKMAVDYQSTYFRVNGDNKTYITHQNVRDAFDKQDFRDLGLANTTTDKIDAVELIFQNSAVKINKENGKWFNVKKEELDNTKVETFLSTAANLKAKDIVTKESVGNPNFTYPYLGMSIKTGSTNTNVLFGQKDKDSNYYTTVNSGEYIYLVPSTNLDSLPKNSDELKK